MSPAQVEGVRAAPPSSCSRVQGTPRRRRSVSTIERNDHRFRCLPCTEGSSTIVARRAAAAHPGRCLRSPVRGSEPHRSRPPARTAHGGWRRARPRRSPRGRARRRARGGGAGCETATRSPGLPGSRRRAEHRRQLRVGVEPGANPRQRLGVDHHVGVDEGDQIAARRRHARVACCRGTRPGGLVDHDELVGRLVEASSASTHRASVGGPSVAGTTTAIVWGAELGIPN